MSSNYPFVRWFIDDIEDPKLVTAIFDFNSAKSNFKYVCFVESKVDAKFYSHILYKKINVSFENTYYIPCGSKSNVLYMPKYIVNKYKISEENNSNYVFIVDHDYDGVKIDKSKFQIISTCCYSIENYLLMNQNLPVIFPNKNDLHSFRILLENYITCIIMYETLLKLKTMGFHNMSLGEEERMIYSGYIEGNTYIISQDYYNKIFEKYRFFIKKEPSYYDLYTKTRDELKSQYQYIKGHDLEHCFNLFVFQKYKHDIKLKDLLINKLILEKCTIEVNKAY